MAELNQNNKNKVSFGRGVFENYSKTAGMVYFSTNTNEILIADSSAQGYKAFGLSTTDAAKIDASIIGVDYKVGENSAVITFTRNGEDNLSDSISFEIPLADKSQPGLMTAGQVAGLEAAAASLLILRGDENTAGSVAKAEKDAKEYAAGLVDALDLAEVYEEGQAIVKISQEDGKVSAEAGNISANYVNVVADHKVTSTPEGGGDAVTEVKPENITVQEAFNYVNEKIKDLQIVADGVQNVVNTAINALDTEESDEGEFVTVTVTQADGLITSVKVDESDIASAAALKSLSDKVGGEFTAENTVAAAIEAVSNAVSTLETGKVADNTAAIAKEVEDREKAISDAVAGLKGTLGEGEADTLAGIHDRIDRIKEAAEAISYSIEKVAKDKLGTTVKEAYVLVDNTGAAIGEQINIYKDSSMKSITLVDKRPADANKGETEDVPGQFLKYEYYNAEGVEDSVYVDVNLLLAESEFKNGLQVSDSGEVSVLVDDDSEDFLTVSATGIKVSGIQDAIDTAVGTEKERAQAAEKALEDAIAANAKLSENYESVSYASVAGSEDFGECKFGAAAAGDSLEDAIYKVDHNVAELLGGVLRNELTVSTAITDLDSRLDAISGENGSLATALEEAKDYTDEKVAELANGAVKANTEAIAATNATIGNGFGTGEGQKTVTAKVAELEEAIKANTDSMLWWEGD